jgi:hypothetical protein
MPINNPASSNFADKVIILSNLQTIQVLLSRMEMFKNMFDETNIKDQEFDSIPKHEFNKIVQLQKASKKIEIFSYEMLFLGVNEKIEQAILSEFIGYTWDPGFAVLSYEFKQFEEKNKRCLSIQFKSKKYFKMPEEDSSIKDEKSWDENLSSNYLQKNIYSRLSDKEQFYGTIWGHFDEKELPKAYFLTDKKKYYVIWCKRAYLELA